MFWESNRYALLLALLVGVAGCTDDQTPEARLYAWVAEAERAAEARSSTALKALIAPTYRDREGRDRRTLMRLIAGYRLGYREPYILTRVANVDWPEPGQARVVLFAAMASTPESDEAGLLPTHAEIQRFDLELEDLDGGWRLVSAAWRPARTTDFNTE